MRFPNAGSTELPEPEWDWGVENTLSASQSKMECKGRIFKVVVFFSVIALMAIFGQEFFDIKLPLSNAVILGLAVCFAVSFAVDLYNRTETKTVLRYTLARTESLKRQVEWEREILAPYLSKCYGLELVRIDHQKNEAVVTSRGSEIRVRFDGISFFPNTGFNLPSGDYSESVYNATVSPDEISVEQVTQRTTEKESLS